MDNSPQEFAPNYADIFERRGREHAEAFRRFPGAVDSEVGSLLELGAIRRGEVVLDVPSASGFLSRHLNVQGVRLYAADPSPVLHQLCKQAVVDAYCAPMSDLPFEAGTFDVVLCLAGLHHEPSLVDFFLETRRVLKRGGRFVIAEVDEGTRPARFLNEFVDKHSTLGHQGRFFCDAYRDALAQAGFRIERERLADYHWRFDCADEIAECLALMFGIDRAAPETIRRAVDEILGIDSFPDGKVGMRWCLRQLLCVPDISQGRLPG